MTEQASLSEQRMTAFRIGERVALKSCADFPGTVTGIVYGKVEVRFDDLSNESPRSFRPESLQLISSPVSVSKPVASGTRILFPDRGKESAICRAAYRELFGTGTER